jgi:hypothetical protein
MVPKAPNGEHGAGSAEQTNDFWTVPREAVSAKVQNEEKHDCGGAKQRKANQIELSHGVLQHFQPVWLVKLLGDIQEQ